MFFPDLGDISAWAVVGHADAGVKTMPDKVNCVGGSVLMLCNIISHSAIVLSWRSKILKRKVTSSLAGECYALNSLLGDMIYMKAILVQLFGQRLNIITLHCFYRL